MPPLLPSTRHAYSGQTLSLAVTTPVVEVCTIAWGSVVNVACCAGGILKRGRGLGTVEVSAEVPKSSPTVQLSVASESTICTTRLRTTTATIPWPVFALAAIAGEVVSFSLGQAGRLMSSMAIRKT